MYVKSDYIGELVVSVHTLIQTYNAHYCMGRSHLYMINRYTHNILFQNLFNFYLLGISECMQ